MRSLVWGSRLCYTKTMGKEWTMSDEARAKISAAAKKRYEGYTVLAKCKQCPNEYKVSKTRLADGRGKFCSKTCKIDASKGVRVAKGTEFKKGQKPWNAGIGVKLLCQVCGNEYRQQPNRKNLHCSIECRKLSAKRFYLCQHCSEPFEFSGMGEARKPKFCSKRCHGLGFRGENNPLWKGGQSREREIAKGRIEYKLWRKAVFDRDNYTCQMCGDRGVYIEADHIKQWALYPDLRYELSNGRTLCRPCHKTTPSWGRLDK